MNYNLFGVKRRKERIKYLLKSTKSKKSLKKRHKKKWYDYHVTHNKSFFI